MKKLINRLGIKAEATYGARVIPRGFSRSIPWTVTLKRSNPRRQLTTPFFIGIGHSGEPTAEQVLECLVSDALSVEGENSAEAWLYSFGMENTAETRKLFKEVVRQTAKVKRFLGEDFDAFVEAL